jgi:hypothetical protein
MRTDSQSPWWIADYREGANKPNDFAGLMVNRVIVVGPTKVVDWTAVYRARSRPVCGLDRLDQLGYDYLNYGYNFANPGVTYV